MRSLSLYSYQKDERALPGSFQNWRKKFLPLLNIVSLTTPAGFFSLLSLSLAF
jgi:hypothetical protein